MKFSEYLKSVNKTKVHLKLERWVELKQYYLSMFRFYMLKLYDQGYISDPTRFNEEELKQNLVEMGIYDFRNKNGKVLIDSLHADFAGCKYKDDSEKVKFLKLLYEALKYKEYSLEIDKQYENYGTDLKFSFVMKNSILVTSVCIIDYNKGVFNTLCPDGYCLGSISINEDIFKYAMETLGVPESVFGSDMFVRGLTLEETIKFSDIILEGDTTLDGKFAGVLNEWLDTCSKNCKGLYYTTCMEKMSELTEIISSKKDSLGDDFVILYKDKLYYKKPILKYRLPVGMFICVTTHDEDDIIDTDWSALYGYTGEAYTRDYLDDQRIDYVGIPIQVNINGEETYVYDSSQLILSVEPTSWFEQESNDVSFSFEEGYTVFNPYSLGTVERALVEAYVEGRRGNIYEVDSSIGSLKDIRNARKKMLSKFIKIINM